MPGHAPEQGALGCVMSVHWLIGKMALPLGTGAGMPQGLNPASDLGTLQGPSPPPGCSAICQL